MSEHANSNRGIGDPPSPVVDDPGRGDRVRDAIEAAVERATSPLKDEVQGMRQAFEGLKASVEAMKPPYGPECISALTSALLGLQSVVDRLPGDRASDGK